MAVGLFIRRDSFSKIKLMLPSRLKRLIFGHCWQSQTIQFYVCVGKGRWGRGGGLGTQILLPTDIQSEEPRLTLRMAKVYPRVVK